MLHISYNILVITYLLLENCICYTWYYRIILTILLNFISDNEISVIETITRDAIPTAESF